MSLPIPIGPFSIIVGIILTIVFGTLIEQLVITFLGVIRRQLLE
ncbi:hypothetical protein [Pyrobaculum aerophilum]|uniref:Conserved within P. aerophilum part 1, authentic frameshift n=1 Tax=Pyrobaculum aerophilum (strain ATCC 51768 / DSM 7523 / JCM 9630 / CIP 104966 / NBRC 100827 / IM2) TaxID=178306 RepID=Q8ZXG8_PYRAE|nr:hypothetical protein [Pyrobaculum aerophilum]AAL63380.1 conserved within P. aerophilum part 1, authentic frameshift [Pyrobaculum aerophilum str. IM2]